MYCYDMTISFEMTKHTKINHKKPRHEKFNQRTKQCQTLHQLKDVTKKWKTFLINATAKKITRAD
jgi:hypothetical protein